MFLMMKEKKEEGKKFIIRSCLEKHENEFIPLSHCALFYSFLFIIKQIPTPWRCISSVKFMLEIASMAIWEYK